VTFEEDGAGTLAKIMATCGRLKSLIFKAQPFVDIRMLVDAQRPWVCTGLEVFEGCFGLSLPSLSFLPSSPPRDYFPSPLACNEFADNPGAILSRQCEKLFRLRLRRLTKLRSVVVQHNTLERYFDDEEDETMTWSLVTKLNASRESRQPANFQGRSLLEGLGFS
jgi:hypothetical protein